MAVSYLICDKEVCAHEKNYDALLHNNTAQTQPVTSSGLKPSSVQIHRCTKVFYHHRAILMSSARA